MKVMRSRRHLFQATKSNQHKSFVDSDERDKRFGKSSWCFVVKLS